ncbi:MAG: hypothetical protein AAGH73_00230 [Pseudomonadota bacterium]
MRHRIATWRMAGLTGSVLGLVGLASLAEEGGLRSTLTLSQGVEVAQNPSLSTGEEDSLREARVGLGYTLETRTRTEALRFSARGDVRAATDEAGVDVARPELTLSYGIATPRLALALDVAARQSDLRVRDATALARDTDGALTVPSDLDDLGGAGTRTDLRFSARATLDEERPGSVTVGLAGQSLSYAGTTAPGLVDRTRIALDLGARFALSRVTRVEAGLGFGIVEEDGAAAREIATLRAGVQSARSARLVARAGVELAFPEAGRDRATLLAGVTHRLSPRSELSFDAGVTLIDGADAEPVYRARLMHALSRRLEADARLRREVTSPDGQETTVSTGALLGLDLTLTPLSQLSLDATFLRQGDIETDARTTRLALSSTYRRALTEDWSAAMGLRLSARETGTGARASSEALFLRFERRWQTRGR